MYEACSRGAQNASLALTKLMSAQVRVMVMDIETKKTVSTHREQVKSFAEKCISAYRKDTIILQSNVARYPAREIVGIFTMFIEKPDARKIGETIIQKTKQTPADQNLIQSAIIEMANIISNSYTNVLSKNSEGNYVGDDSKIIGFESFDKFLNAMLTGGSLEMNYIFFENILVVEQYALKIPALMGFSEKFFNSNKTKYQ